MYSWLGWAIDLLCDGTAVPLHLWASVPKELSAFVSTCVYVGGNRFTCFYFTGTWEEQTRFYFLKRPGEKRSYMQRGQLILIISSLPSAVRLKAKRDV